MPNFVVPLVSQIETSKELMDGGHGRYVLDSDIKTMNWLDEGTICRFKSMRFLESKFITKKNAFRIWS